MRRMMKRCLNEHKLGRVAFGSPVCGQGLFSSGFAGDDPVGGRGVDVECSDIGLGLEQVLQHFMDLGILLLVVAFGILFAVPKAQSQNPGRFRVRNQDGLVDEAALFLRIGRTFSLMVFASSLALPDSLVSSTMRVNMRALLSWLRVKGTVAGATGYASRFVRARYASSD